MERTDHELANKAFLNLPVFGDLATRVPQHRFDFGDDGTRLKSLKRVGRNPFEGDHNDMFALFLGCYEGKFIVGIHDLGFQLKFNATEAFETEEEMKNKWQLD